MKKLLALLLLFGIVGCASVAPKAIPKLYQISDINLCVDMLEESIENISEYQECMKKANEQSSMKDYSKDVRGARTNYWTDTGLYGTYVGQTVLDGLSNKFQAHGQGTLTSPNGDKYVGEFKANEKSGQGTLTTTNGDKFTGVWKNDVLTGQVAFTFVSGTKYVGEYKNKIKQGLSNERAPYRSELINYKITGQGTMTNPDGSKYVGEFFLGLPRIGQGTYIYANGNKYVGETWVNKGIHFGEGTYTYANGNKYVGEFKNLLFDGEGTYTYANGDKYVGAFKEGNFNGQGIYIHADGLQDRGVWKNNRLRKARVLSAAERDLYAAECYETRFKDVQRLGEIYQIRKNAAKGTPLYFIQNLTDRYLEDVRYADAEYERCKKVFKVFYYGAAIKL